MKKRKHDFEDWAEWVAIIAVWLIGAFAIYLECRH